ncbi:MAG: TerC family protein, partial [Bacteroidota bacterium]
MEAFFPDFANGAVWMSLLTLTFLEIVLGIDNIIFITIAAGKLPPEQRKKATNLGLLIAMGLRIVLLMGISILTAMNQPLSWASFGHEGDAVYAKFTGQSLILITGGIFLLYKATKEIGHKLEGGGHAEEAGKTSGKTATLSSAIVQITVINIVFSIDSILTAVGMTNGLEGALFIMIFGVVSSVIIMML